MAMKEYSDEFKADAVALCESTPGATYKSIAADLGVNGATLREWVQNMARQPEKVTSQRWDTRSLQLPVSSLFAGLGPLRHAHHPSVLEIECGAIVN
ncbi:transposase [Streptomyces sp. NPDC048419]|uniref:transposase n=1 Tax=Streptomyces sp. NPDC048419 TaxID=3365547 RepID=UPI003719374F